MVRPTTYMTNDDVITDVTGHVTSHPQAPSRLGIDDRIQPESDGQPAQPGHMTVLRVGVSVQHQQRVAVGGR